MKSRSVILLLFIVVLLSVILSAFFYRSKTVVDSLDIPMDLFIADKVGFNLNNDSIHFGSTYKGGTSRRFLTFSNTYGFPVKLNIQTSGEIAKYVSVSNNNFIIPPNSRVDVTFIATMPVDIEYGNYTGTSHIRFIKTP